MRQKNNNIPALVAAIQVKCPDLTVENIVNHEAWYKVYLNLREKQRLTIRQWRKQKETEKARIHENKITIEKAGEISHEKSNPDIAKKLPLRAPNKCETKTKLDKVVDNDGTNQKKELIRQWRLERENKRLIEEQQFKMLTESKLAAQEKRKQERLKKVKMTLAEYHERKLTELSTKVSKNDSKAECKYDPALIEAFR